jgi:hypothetical protein
MAHMIGLEAILGGIVAALVAIAAAFIRGRSAGAQAERAKQDAAARKSLESRNKTDDEIARMSPDDRLRRLDGWVPDDGK